MIEILKLYSKWITNNISDNELRLKAERHKDDIVGFIEDVLNIKLLECQKVFLKRIYKENKNKGVNKC